MLEMSEDILQLSANVCRFPFLSANVSQCLRMSTHLQRIVNIQREPVFHRVWCDMWQSMHTFSLISNVVTNLLCLHCLCLSKKICWQSETPSDIQECLQLPEQLFKCQLMPVMSANDFKQGDHRRHFNWKADFFGNDSLVNRNLGAHSLQKMVRDGSGCGTWNNPWNIQRKSHLGASTVVRGLAIAKLLRRRWVWTGESHWGLIHRVTICVDEIFKKWCPRGVLEPSVPSEKSIVCNRATRVHLQTLQTTISTRSVTQTFLKNQQCATHRHSCVHCLTCGVHDDC